MSKMQKMKFGMKVLKGRHVIARGATPGMGSNIIIIAPGSKAAKSDEVAWGKTDGVNVAQ